MSAAVLGALVGILAYVTLLERKFAARLQSRIGPYRVGPHGLLQPIADGVKLLLKEDLVPALADRPIFNLAPVVFLVPCLLIFATIPFAPGHRRRRPQHRRAVLPRRVVDGDRRPVHGRAGARTTSTRCCR